MLQFYYGENENEIQAGVDEVGRGCLSGPVVSAAVIWSSKWLNEHKHIYEKELSQIMDSKKISEKKRQTVANFIKTHATAYGISFVSAEVIDEINILNATHRAMHRAIDHLFETNEEMKIDSLLIDGNSFKMYRNRAVRSLGRDDEDDQLMCIPHVCIVNGDSKYISIASASIIAKVARDEFMTQLCKKDAQLNDLYDWINNKGYGTKKHIRGIETHGLSVHHRRTFGICRRHVVQSGESAKPGENT